jgi:hypothetical protein
MKLCLDLVSRRLLKKNIYSHYYDNILPRDLIEKINKGFSWVGGLIIK